MTDNTQRERDVQMYEYQSGDDVDDKLDAIRYGLLAGDRSIGYRGGRRD